MASWSLPLLLEGVHKDIESRLDCINLTIGHAPSKGDGSEVIWKDIFNDYLPARYQAEKAFVVDSNNNFSDQIDIVIFDRQYSPFIFKRDGQVIVPAESVYAIFESKQKISKGDVVYAAKKIESVRKLHRTSLPIPHAGGTYPPKRPFHIIGGILALNSDWNSNFGDPLRNVLAKLSDQQQVDIGCAASFGYFSKNANSDEFCYIEDEKAVTSFIFDLISKLQFCGTVPMIDVLAYSKWTN
ncbi:hypothetical protein OAT67_02225 [Bacteriovoracaceae bacterium]|nr:hypothetical protein [Bacteriovoracaceae bacterium]